MAVTLEGYREKQRTKAAYRKTIDLAASNKEFLALTWARFGDFLNRHSSRLDEAREALETALALNPNDAKTLVVWGVLNETKLDYLSHLPKRLSVKQSKSDAKNYVAWVYLGNLLREHLSQFAEAENAYRKAIHLDPNKVWAWGKLGELLAENLFAI